MSGKSKIGLTATLLAIVVLTIVGATYVHISEARTVTPNVLLNEAKNLEIDKLEVEIVSVSDTSIIVTTEDGSSLELLAKGRWIVIDDRLVFRRWANASRYVREGEAIVLVSTIERGNESVNIVLGIRQDGTTLFRPILLKVCAKGYRHTGMYMSVRGELVEKGGNYMVLERNGHKLLASVRGEWIKAGERVKWEDVSSEFNVGDEVRLFCHNILIMNEEFSETFGISGFIWGYSGAILDLTSGVALSKG